MVHDLSDRSEVVFDDERVVANAGIVLAVTLGGGWGSRRSSTRPSSSAGGRGVAAGAQGALADPRDAARRRLHR